MSGPALRSMKVAIVTLSSSSAYMLHRRLSEWYQSRQTLSINSFFVYPVVLNGFLLEGGEIPIVTWLGGAVILCGDIEACRADFLLMSKLETCSSLFASKPWVSPSCYITAVALLENIVGLYVSAVSFPHFHQASLGSLPESLCAGSLLQ